MFSSLLVASMLILNVNFVYAQNPEDLTVEYNEYLETYILSTGDSINHWEIYEQGSGKLNFPILLSDPNASSSAVIDGNIILTAVESAPLPLDLGLFAGQYGGFMYTDLDGEDWRYGYSHIFLEINLEFDDLANLTSGYSYRDAVLADFSENFGLNFYPYDSDAAGGNWWTFQYSLTLADYSYFFEAILDHFTLNENLLPKADRFLSSPNKAIRIQAQWDEFDPSPSSQDSELRWEYNADIHLFEQNTIEINQDGNTQVYFRDVLQKTGDIEIEDWVNDSSFDIYLYKGAKITEASNPTPTGTGQDYAHIYREMDTNGHVSGYLPDSAHFNFTHGIGLIPLLDVSLTVDDTTVGFNETIQVTRTITNVGNVTAYNIQTSQPGYDFLSGNDFNLTSGDIFAEIDDLEPGEVDVDEMQILCNHNNTYSREYQVNLAYDATMDPGLDDHFSEPQYGASRYISASNRIRIHHNNATAQPWFTIDYDLSNHYPHVGEELTVDMRLTNIGDIDAEQINWEVLPFPDDNHESPIGYNTTPHTGNIARINAGEFTELSVIFDVEAYNHYFGSETGIACDLSFSPFNETTTISMNSDNNNYNDAGSTRILILPEEEVIIGPILKVDVELEPIIGIAGDSLDIMYNITNMGNSIAYNVDPTARFQYPGAPKDYNLTYHGGYDLFSGGNLGDLNPGESYIFNSRYLLLTNISMTNFTIQPLVEYDYLESGNPNNYAFNCFATSQNFNFEELLGESEKGVNAARVWMIISFVAIAGLVAESIVLYKKIKPF